MAKTPVTLQVKDFVDREVLSVDYKFNQTTDKEGQISGLPRGGEIDITVKALNDGNNQLLQWMLDPTDPRDVKIVFNNTIDSKVMKTLEGTGCYCIHYDEKWEDGKQHQEHIVIVCQELNNGGVLFHNDWA